MPNEGIASVINEVRAKTAQGRLLWDVVPVTPPIHMVYFTRVASAHPPLRLTLTQVLAADVSLLIENADTGRTVFLARAADPGLDRDARDALCGLLGEVKAATSAEQEPTPQGVLEALQAV